MLIRIEISDVLHPLIPVIRKNLSGDFGEIPEETPTDTILDLLRK